MFATDQTGHARWIGGYVLARGLTTITTRDVIRAYRPLRAPEDRKVLLEVMASLEAMGWLREKAEQDGRMPTAWHVNPAIHTEFADRARREKETRMLKQEHVRTTLAKQRRAA